MPNEQEVQLALLAAAGRQSDIICGDTDCDKCKFSAQICTSLLNLYTEAIRNEWHRNTGKSEDAMDLVLDRIEEATRAILDGVEPKSMKEPDSGTHLGSERLPELFVWVIAIIRGAPNPRVVVGYRNTNCEGDYLAVPGEAQIWWFRILEWRYLHEAWPDKFTKTGAMINVHDDGI